jgi:hypothetical protein
MYQLIRYCLVSVILSTLGSAGTITYLSRDAWQSAVDTLGQPFATDNFSNPTGASPSLNFSLLALTSTGKSTADSSDQKKPIKVDTSFIDLFANPDGGNYVGTVGRTAVSTTTVTTTNSEWCKNGTCVPGTEQQTTQTSTFSDVRSLEMDFTYPTLAFGFDYVATLAGSSPDSMNHAFRMVLTFVDGTTSRAWVNSDLDFASYQEGFMGITSDLAIVSATLHAPDRSLGSTVTTSGGDWTYQLTKPKKGDFYTYSLTQTVSSDQSSALLITNLTTMTPEPAPVTTMALGMFLIGVGCLLRRRYSRNRAR